MARTNVHPETLTITTHEGGRARAGTPEAQLRRSLMSALLFEDTFYEDGQSIAERIAETVPKIDPHIVSAMAIEARTQMNLRHAPLWVVLAMVRSPLHRPFVAQTLAAVIQRPDELGEFLAMYWKDGKTPIAAQVKKGLAKAIKKFNAFTLAKYDRDTPVKLRDVLFLTHPKPGDESQTETFKKLAERSLDTPVTWETELSAGKDKKATWELLIRAKKLGALAFLRNLRNMEQAGVDRGLIRQGLAGVDTRRVLPFRFIAAARYAPSLEADLESLLFSATADSPKLVGTTTILVDVSGSMDQQLSGKSDMTRLDAVCGVAMVLREVCDDVKVFTFSNSLQAVPSRRGFALRDAIVGSQPHSSTRLGAAVQALRETVPMDRLVVVTDEQAQDELPPRPACKGYLLNVAPYQHGVGYGSWVTINGFSEAVVKYLLLLEADQAA